MSTIEQKIETLENAVDDFIKSSRSDQGLTSEQAIIHAKAIGSLVCELDGIITDLPKTQAQGRYADEKQEEVDSLFNKAEETLEIAVTNDELQKVIASIQRKPREPRKM